MTTVRPPLRLILTYAILSLASVAAGCVVCAVSDVPTGSWARNLVAWVVGLGGAALMARLAGARTSAVLLGVALVAVCASLAGPPQQGVHRWLDLGPLHVNVAFIVLPVAVVAFGQTTKGLWAWGAVAIMQIVLVVQPDASQATAFGVAVALIAIRAPAPRLARLGFAGLMLGLAAGAWLRPDPLEAVAEVEEIVGLAAAIHPAAGVLLVLIVAGTGLAPLWATWRTPPARSAGLALSTYMLCAVAVTVLGAFPMPLLGVGMSPVLGLWLGVGLLASSLRQAEKPEPTPASGS